MSHLFYKAAKHFEGEGDLPFSFTTGPLQQVFDCLAENPTLRQSYIKITEHRAKIAELRSRREYLRTRGYKMAEDMMQEVDIEIGLMCFAETKMQKDYEMIRRLWAFEIDDLKL